MGLEQKEGTSKAKLPEIKSRILAQAAKNSFKLILSQNGALRGFYDLVDVGDNFDKKVNENEPFGKGSGKADPYARKSITSKQRVSNDSTMRDVQKTKVMDINPVEEEKVQEIRKGTPQNSMKNLKKHEVI